MVPKVAKKLFKTLGSIKDSETAAPDTILQEIYRAKIASGIILAFLSYHVLVHQVADVIILDPLTQLHSTPHANPHTTSPTTNYIIIIHQHFQHHTTKHQPHSIVREPSSQSVNASLDHPPISERIT